MKKDPAMKMKKASMAKNKMKMVKGPDGKMVPDFAVDGKGKNDMKSSVATLKKSMATLKKSMAKLKKDEKSAMAMKKKGAMMMKKMAATKLMKKK